MCSAASIDGITNRQSVTYVFGLFGTYLLDRSLPAEIWFVSINA
jgi:hypothetical protein